MLNKWNEMSATLRWCVRENVSKINIAHGNGGEEPSERSSPMEQTAENGRKAHPNANSGHISFVSCLTNFLFRRLFCFQFPPASHRRSLHRHSNASTSFYSSPVLRRIVNGFFPQLPLPANFSSYFHFFRMVRVPLISIAPITVHFRPFVFLILSPNVSFFESKALYCLRAVQRTVWACYEKY